MTQKAIYRYKRTGFFIQESQRSIFDELNGRKKPHKKNKIAQFTPRLVNKAWLGQRPGKDKAFLVFARPPRGPRTNLQKETPRETWG